MQYVCISGRCALKYLQTSGCVAFTFTSIVAGSAGRCRGHGAVVTTTSASDAVPDAVSFAWLNMVQIAGMIRVAGGDVHVVCV